MKDPTTRFSTRVENYIRFRPRYPQQILPILERECGLTPLWAVADIGSGTGMLSELFLANGNPVSGVEPNREMREAGRHLLSGYTRFAGVDGRAEATTLPDASVDLVTAGQAFHWFDLPSARSEFERILRPHGWVALIWNTRRRDASEFAQAYERLLLAYAVEYRLVDHRNLTEETIAGFFRPGSFRRVTVENRQVFDYQGLQGRLMSSSYAPEPGHPNHGPMLAELGVIFGRLNLGGVVAFEYDTEVYVGRLWP